MRLDDIPLFSMLKGQMGYLNARQRVISENVANADTPGFTPHDLKRPNFDQVLSAQGVAARTAGPTQLAATQAGHIAPKQAPAGSAYKAQVAPDSETRMDGNSVVLEEEMVKMAESRMAYDTAVSLYQKSVNMLRMAARAPGR